MSAIAGLWERGGRNSRESLVVMAGEMGNALRRRGPDGGDLWSDDGAGYAVVHRSLRASDRYAAREQPVVSSCGRFLLCCDGEVYNAVELAAELRAAGRQLPGRSDLEVIVEGAAAWGIEAIARRLNAHFAAALWDCERKVLHLLRDRLGTRPLYWARTDSLFLFGSELKAMRACASFQAELDRDALAAYLRRKAVPDPHTIYRQAKMLQPGSILTLQPHGEPTIRRYWTLEETARHGQSNRFSGSDSQAIDRYDRLLRDAASRRVGDSPLGVFLSGGFDSALLLAVTQTVTAKPVLSFSAGFRETDYDEAGHAAQLARHLQVEHYPLFILPEHASQLIPSLAEIYDEPNGDISQIPAYFLSQLARQHVGVAFTGDGATEALSGSGGFDGIVDLYRRIQSFPLPARRMAKAAIRSLSPGVWTSLAHAVPAGRRPPHLGDKLYKLASILTGDEDDTYQMSRSYWLDPEALVIGGREPQDLPENPRVKSFIPDFADRIYYYHTLSTLPHGALTKTDRAARAHGLHIRLPFLDNALVEFGWSLPKHLKSRDGITKWLVREAAYRYFPREIIERKKMGFDVPMGSWLRGPLRDWAEELLDERRLKREGIFRPAEIRTKWRAHLEGRSNWQGPLWVLLMFQAWKQRWLPTP